MWSTTTVSKRTETLKSHLLPFIDLWSLIRLLLVRESIIQPY